MSKTNMSPFPTYYEEYIHVSRYARWMEDEGRRETWYETVTRLVDYYKSAAYLEEEVADRLWDAIYGLEVMPSMRALMAAGPALDKCNVAAYNCAYLPINHIRCFDEAMYILMCGTGVGFSVEEKYTHQLPTVPDKLENNPSVIIVGDSKEGWATALKQLISSLYSGVIPEYDTSGVRPAGSRLKTFGGRASGPEPLIDLFEFTINLFKKAQGRRLTTIECHDLMCKIAEIVVVGGVRRSALISLSDVTDERMRSAKSGNWWEMQGQRALANNSAVYENRRPDMDLFLKEWKALYDSKSGERGLFSRKACQTIVEKSGRRSSDHEFGTNPCSEIILRPFQFCNLTEVVVRPEDDKETLLRKVETAAILGTIQSLFSDFKYLRKIWQHNTEEERLLGVSLTGLMDHPTLMSNSSWLKEMKQKVIDTNKEWATYLSINPSAATTCVKPSGTVSQLVNSASGMHKRHSQYYIRTVRNDAKDPLSAFLIDQGIPNEVDITSSSNIVFSFPVASPESSELREDTSAVKELEAWKLLQEHWCEHKPSVTIYVQEHEWMEVGAWVYSNFDYMSGVSFLPYDGGTYRQAPYQEVTEEKFIEFKKKMPPTIIWEDLQNYENEDNTIGSQELACTGGACEI